MVFLIIVTVIVSIIPTAYFIIKKRIPLAIIAPITCFVVLILTQSFFPLVIAGVLWFFAAMIVPENNSEAVETKNMVKGTQRSRFADPHAPAPNPAEASRESSYDTKPVTEAQDNSNSSGEWMCPFCGKLNKSIVRTCECGTKKSEKIDL